MNTELKEILKVNFGEDAEEVFEELRERADDLICRSCSLFEIEELLLEYGLELDYAMDLFF